MQKSSLIRTRTDSPNNCLSQLPSQCLHFRVSTNNAARSQYQTKPISSSQLLPIDFEGMVEEYMAGLESIMQCEPVNTIPGVNRSAWNFLFQKELKRSDVGPTRRIVIPKRDAEVYLPPLTNKRGLFMLVHDMDIERIWTFRYRCWNNSNSPMFILEKTGDFVLEHGLRAGDFIVIYKDNERGIYGIQARKAVSLEVSRQNEEARLMNNHSTLVIWDKIDTYFPPEISSISNLPGEVMPDGQTSDNH